MKYEIKCSSCNAPIPIIEDQTVHFCPYCGASVKIKETNYDFKRFKMKHEEEVRKQKVKEKEQQDWKTIKMLLLMVLCLILYMLFSSIMLRTM